MPMPVERIEANGVTQNWSVEQIGHGRMAIAVSSEPPFFQSVDGWVSPENLGPVGISLEIQEYCANKMYMINLIYRLHVTHRLVCIIVVT